MVAKRLLDYISAALLSPQQLENHLIIELKEIYSQSYTNYVEELNGKQSELGTSQDFKQILIDSFNRQRYYV